MSIKDCAVGLAVRDKIRTKSVHCSTQQPHEIVLWERNKAKFDKPENWCLKRFALIPNRSVYKQIECLQNIESYLYYSRLIQIKY